MNKFALTLVGALGLSSIAQGATSGDFEKRALREAAAGNLENVFIVRALGGFIALPRTFVMLGLRSPPARFAVDMHTDATLGEPGYAVLGQLVTSKEGGRIDGSTGSVLPTSPIRVENRGPAIIEYFEPTTPSDYPKALVTVGGAYVLFTGSATVVATEFVDAYLALTGPPDVFARHGPATAHQLCKSRVIDSDYVIGAEHEHHTWMLRVRAGADVQAFQNTGFADGDLIVAVNRKPLAQGDELQALIAEAANAGPMTFSIVRGQTQIGITLQPKIARNILCH